MSATFEKIRDEQRLMDEQLFALHHLVYKSKHNAQGMYAMCVILNLRSTFHLSEHDF